MTASRSRRPIASHRCGAGGSATRSAAIFAITASLEPRDAKTFVLTLKEPSGLVIDALGNPVSPVAFMMPERVAKTPADQRITEIIGSGPFVYSKADHRTGDRMILKKFAGYVPRSEPADFLAGGKRVNIDTLEIASFPTARPRHRRCRPVKSTACGTRRSICCRCWRRTPR